MMFVRMLPEVPDHPMIFPRRLQAQPAVSVAGASRQPGKACVSLHPRADGDATRAPKKMNEEGKPEKHGAKPRGPNADSVRVGSGLVP